MLGIMINEFEQRELEYLIKCEMDNLRTDIEDSGLDTIVRNAIADRYKVLFSLLRRVTSEHEALKYIPENKKWSE